MLGLLVACILSIYFNISKIHERTIIKTNLFRLLFLTTTSSSGESTVEYNWIFHYKNTTIVIFPNANCSVIKTFLVQKLPFSTFPRKNKIHVRYKLHNMKSNESNKKTSVNGIMWKHAEVFVVSVGILGSNAFQFNTEVSFQQSKFYSRTFFECTI